MKQCGECGGVGGFHYGFCETAERRAARGPVPLPQLPGRGALVDTPSGLKWIDNRTNAALASPEIAHQSRTENTE